MTLQQDPARLFAEHIASARAAALPARTVAITTRDILDTFGCLLGGSDAPGIATIRNLALRNGGMPAATIALASQRVPAQVAALVNGAMAHALDYDDTHDKAGAIHPGAPVLAAALAAMEESGGASGLELVQAVALGLDVACRIALASRQDRGWHRTAAIGVFGATAAAARLFRLDAARTHHALGIALSQAAGTRQCIDDGAMTKRFQAGQAASAGVLAALLAKEDFTGADRVFSGRYGFFALYQPEDRDLAALTRGLGEIWEGDGLSLKPYPCFRPSHPAIDAAIGLRRELRLGGAGEAAAAIAKVQFETDDASFRDQLAPGTHRRRPSHVIEAQFSTPFLVAMALLRGRVTIDDVADVADPTVLALASKIEGVPVRDKPRGWARLTVTLAGAMSATREVADASGSPTTPMSDDALEAKFRDCARHAVVALSEQQVTDVIARIRRLPELSDAREIFASLA